MRHETSLHVGGDYYDFIPLSESVCLFVVADVEGKGAASAMVMANVQATLHTLVRHVHSIEGVLYHLNERILEGTRGGKYLTLFLGLIDLPRRGLHYINAGHVAPLIARADGSVPLRDGGMVVGLMPGTRYRRGHCRWWLRGGWVDATDHVRWLVQRLIAAAQRDRGQHRRPHPQADAVLALDAQRRGARRPGLVWLSTRGDSTRRFGWR